MLVDIKYSVSVLRNVLSNSILLSNAINAANITGP